MNTIKSTVQNNRACPLRGRYVRGSLTVSRFTRRLRSSLQWPALRAPATSAHARLLPILLLTCLIFSGCKEKKQIQADKEPVPQSIVSLSPTATEILFAVGAGSQVAACSELSDYPPEVKELPSAGGFDGKTLSLERILSFAPDFVYLTKGMHDHLIPELDKYNIRWYLSTGESIQDVKDEIFTIAVITGHKAEGEKVIKQLESNLNASKKIREEFENRSSPAVYWEVWNAPYMSAGSSSFINDVIKAAGGKNIFSDIETAYPSVSEESIIIRQPEIILIPASSGVTAASVKARNGWQSIPAVQNNQVYIVDDNIMTRAGPRIGECVLLLTDLFYTDNE